MPDDSQKKSAVVYWPFSIFSRVHTKKDASGIASSLRKKNYDTTLIVGKFLATKIEGIRTYETGNTHYSILSPLAQANEFFKLLKILFRLSPDIVIAFNRNPTFPLIILLYKLINFFRPERNRKTKFLLKMDSDGQFRFTNFPPHSLKNPTFRKILSISAVLMLKLNYLTFDYISIETECGLERIKKIIHNERKIVVIPDGIDSIYFEEASSSIAERGNVILAVSRVARQKSLEILIEAFTYIHREFPDWVVKVVGEIEDPDYFQELVKNTEKYKLEDKVHFVGSVSEADLLNFYATSAIFCLPSNWEGFPISRLEAIAMGLPVITTEAGCGESLRKYGSIVVPVNDAKSLAEGLRLLMSDSKLRQKIVKSQRGAVISWDDVVEMYLTL